jgi:4-amino-4-deoxy-L-arabinose transferase-like glycosyltransferase
MLLASIPCSLFLTLITEGLSQLHLLTRTGVVFSWVLFTIGCVWWSKSKYFKPPVDVSPEGSAEAGLPMPLTERIGLTSVLILLGLVGLTAIVSAPNSGDAMQYHLPRVVQWINNGGVQFFTTNERQQLDMPPFTEYGMLHLYLLYGSDRLVALVQWLAYVGFVVAASSITKELGGNRRTQLIAGVLSATIPSAVLGASGTKNECVLAYWIACAVYFMLRWKRCQDWTHAIAIGASLGLAAYTKGTA